MGVLAILRKNKSKSLPVADDVSLEYEDDDNTTPLVRRLSFHDLNHSVEIVSTFPSDDIDTLISKAMSVYDKIRKG